MQEKRISEIGGFWLSQRARSPFWQITWFDAGTRQTRRLSTGTSDLREAETKLAEHVTKEAKPRLVVPAEMPVSAVLTRYWLQHAQNLASADTAKPAIAKWIEFWQDATVNELYPDDQESFIEWLKGQGYRNSYVSRVIGVGRAALRRAWKRQEITSVPFIFDEQDRSDEQEYYRLSKPEMRDLLRAANEYSPHMLMFLMICLNTLCRPGAALDLTSQQVDLSNRRIDLNPPGRKRTKKGRPVVPITNTLLPFLAEGVPVFQHPLRTEESVRRGPTKGRVPATYVNWCGKPITTVRRSFLTLLDLAKLPHGITPYSLRHTMATELRARGVPAWEVEGLLGHKRKGVTEKYAKFAPDYLSLGSTAIDAYFDDLGVSLALHSERCNSTDLRLIPCKIREQIGAGEEDRTLDIHLGKVALLLTLLGISYSLVRIRHTANPYNFNRCVALALHRRHYE